jgi:selenocysteine lyase/cysteine desulfurase
VAIASDLPLARLYRQEFPITGRFIYLNHAAVAPLCRPAAEAMQAWVSEAAEYGAFHYSDWLRCYEELRSAAARLIGAHRDEIAIVKNTSEGIATIASGLRIRPGDKMIAFQEEFPANWFPWKLCEQRGARLEWLSVRDPLEKVDQAASGARLLAISFVQYLDGYRADLNALGEICRRRGCFFFVDAIQGLGAFPFDVNQAHIDALAADGHKWLLGPEGCGVLYVRKQRQEEVLPTEVGWTNFAHYADYASRDLTWRADAGRYECGTLNTVGCYGLRAAIEFLLSIGISRIASSIQALVAQLADGVQQRGYELLLPPSHNHGSGILAIRKPGVDSRMIVQTLREKNIITAPRQGWVRLSPHFYLQAEEIEQVISALP